MNLHLELGVGISVGGLVIKIVLINGLDSALKYLEVVVGVGPELGDEGIVECDEVLHVDFQEVFASLNVGLQLLSVHISVSDLALPNKVHKFVLSLYEVAHFELVATDIDELLVRVKNCVSVHS